MATATSKMKSGSGTMPMETAMDLFVHELPDIGSAEEIILGMQETAVDQAGVELHR